MGRRADPEDHASAGGDPAELPQGILTFLLTDIEASTPLWERHGASMGDALARHQELIARTVAAHGAGSSSGRARGTRPSRSSSGQATQWPRP
jgi:class 3 adenylate cyclase